MYSLSCRQWKRSGGGGGGSESLLEQTVAFFQHPDLTRFYSSLMSVGKGEKGGPWEGKEVLLLRQTGVTLMGWGVVA